MFKVLLVDDEPLVLIGLQGMLDWDKLGWEIVGTARNGKDALEIIQDKRPDLVLCDIKMPVMGGLALAKRCQELDLGLPIFIMLTSYEEFDYVKQSINLGVLEYLVKLDLTPQNLEHALHRAENRIQRERALRAPGSASLSLLSEKAPIAFCRSQSQDYHTQQVVRVQEYICQNLDKRLSLNEVASVFNFSPNYLSQLFAQWGESGFVEFVTATRVNAAKDLMATTDLKIYEISERVGFESAFYFSRVFKKVEGIAPKAYMQRLRGGV